ncbi:MAG: CHAD domain-containing protein [Acidimicrobiaceae bacterium]|nr:CHAD domain-containing protein [Acidimicrobiaceae bacterium]
MERIHQSRVSVRRIRSILRTFEDLFDDASIESLVDDLSWYGGVLGELRDLEVMREHLAELLESLGDVELREVLVARVDHAILESARRRLESRQTSRFLQLNTDIMGLEHVVRFSARSFEVAPRALKSGLKSAWTAVVDRYEVANDDPTQVALHRLRISLKRLQYAGEVAALIDAGPVRRLARSAEKFQTKLGGVHDQSFAKEWIGDIEGVEVLWADALGRISQMHQVVLEERLAGWHKDMVKLRRRWREVKAQR